MKKSNMALEECWIPENVKTCTKIDTVVPSDCFDWFNNEFGLAVFYD